MPDRHLSYNTSPLIPVIGYARVAITRAEIRGGDFAKETMLRVCDERSAVYQRLQAEFSKHSQHTDSSLLASPEFISQMRVQTLRSLAEVSQGQHRRMLTDKTVTPTNQDRPTWADFPNAFVSMARFLIIIAHVTNETMRDELTPGIEAAATESNRRLHELECRLASRHHPRLRGLQP